MKFRACLLRARARVPFVFAFILIGWLSSYAAFAQVKPQQTIEPKRIGIVWLGSSIEISRDIDEFREGLRERGWIEGRNVVIEARFAEGNLERLGEIAANLVQLPVDVLVTAGVPPTLVLKKATQTIPIVVAAATDPLGTGLVTPGGNVAALDILPADAAGRQVNLLREVVPGLSRVAIVWNGSNPAGRLNARRAQEAAQAAGLHVIPIEVQASGQLDAALVGLHEKGVQAIFLISDPSFNRKQVGSLITATGLPTLCQERNWAESGCLVTYGADDRILFRQSASYVDRILKGTPPSDLPIGEPTRYDLVINARSAKSIGLTIPFSVLNRADAVVQ